MAAFRKKITFEPINDRIIVIPEERAKETASGFKMADNSMGEDVTQQGKVIAIGKGRITDNGTRIKPEVKVGDIVVFGMHSGDDLLINEDGNLQRYRGKIITGTILIKVLREDAVLYIRSFK